MQGERGRNNTVRNNSFLSPHSPIKFLCLPAMHVMLQRVIDQRKLDTYIFSTRIISPQF